VKTQITKQRSHLVSPAAETKSETKSVTSSEKNSYRL